MPTQGMTLVRPPMTRFVAAIPGFMSLPSARLGMQTLQGRIQIAWIAKAVLAAVILGFGMVAVDRAVDAIALPTWLPSTVAIVLAILGVLHSLARYRRWGYEVQDDALYLDRGVITYVDTVVPFVRIQHVDTQRGPIARALGLSSVVVYTAGSRGADVTIPGLLPDEARNLRNRLRDLAIESEPEDAV